MIELYRNDNCNLCDEVEEELKTLVITHKIINVEKNNTSVPENLPLPVIKDEDELISGEKEIKQYLEELNKYVALWRKYQVDACYIEDDGEFC